MAYPYGLQGLPAVGYGLPGLPQRQAGGSGITAGGVIPVDAQFGYADEQPANAVEVGAIVEREDYPALSEMIPHTFEQTVQLPIAKPGYTVEATPVVALSKDGSMLFASSTTSATAAGGVFRRTGDSFGSVLALPTGRGVGTAAAFSPTDNVIYYGRGGTAAGQLEVYRINQSSLTQIIGLGDSNFPIKLLAVSPDGTLLAAASSTTTAGVERVKLWRRSGDTFTAVTLPASGNITVYGLEFSKDGKYLYVSQSASPFLRVFDVSVATPVEVATGLDFSLYSKPFTLTALTDGRIICARLTSSGGFGCFQIRVQGSSFSFGPEITQIFPQYIEQSFTYGANILEVGEGFAINTGRAPSGAVTPFRLFFKSGDTFEEAVNPLTNGSEKAPGAIISSYSVSADSKFLALGLSASPWLAVYGSESKMVARLNERSPTGQKLYIKG